MALKRKAEEVQKLLEMIYKVLIVVIAHPNSLLPRHRDDKTGHPHICFLLSEAFTTVSKPSVQPSDIFVSSSLWPNVTTVENMVVE